MRLTPYDDMLCDADNYTSHKVPLHEQDALASLAAQWAREWNIGYPYAALPRLGPDVFQLPPIQASDITRAALSFPCGTGVEVDSLAPRSIARLLHAPIAGPSSLISIATNRWDVGVASVSWS